MQLCLCLYYKLSVPSFDAVSRMALERASQHSLFSSLLDVQNFSAPCKSVVITAVMSGNFCGCRGSAMVVPKVSVKAM